ncbi:MAG TPA: translocation/assembly module TamB domain-containing protein [Terriglobales bacterium]|nr:translocation/assembly module TamB domain-containing protein [Terriglobales bacterium]
MNWKKIILWVAVGILVLVLVTVGTVFLLLKNSTGFRHYLLAKVETNLEQATGARLEVRDFAVHLSPLSLDLYSIVVHGREPAGAPALMHADHLGVGITIDSLLQRKWHFREITLDHPVGHLLVNRAGENNLPKPQKKSSGSQTSVFDLGIRHLLLDRGEIYYNDQKSPMEADLHDLRVTGGFDPTQARYQGRISYDTGHLRYGKYAPLMHSLDASFSVTPQQFAIEQAKLSTEKSRITLNATVEDYSGANSNPKLQANYDAVLVTQEFAQVLKNSQIPIGTIRLTGYLRYQNQPGRPALENASLWGVVSSPELQVRTKSLQTTIREFAAKYRLDGGNADVENLRAQLLGGSLEGRVTVQDLTGAGRGRLEATLKNVSLTVLQGASKTNSLRQAHLAGTISADAEASWAKSLKNLVAHANATMRASVGQNPVTPLDGVIHADYLGAKQQVALHQSYIRMPQTSINLDGKISQISQLQILVHSRDLHELELLARNFRSPSAGQPQELGLYGSGSLNASISGSVTNPQIKGQLTANNLRVKGSAWKSLRANISANPSQARITNGELLAATRGRFDFNVQAGLSNWAYKPANPLNVSLSASQLSLADLERLANKTYPIAGTLSLNVALHGSQLNPMGQGNLTVMNARVGNEPVQNVSVKFQGNGNAVNANLQVQMPAGQAKALVTYLPRTQGYQLQLAADNIRLEKLQTVKEKNLQIAGGLNLDANGRGTFKDPELIANLNIPQLQVRQQTIQGISFNTTVRNHAANFALNSAVAQTYIKGHGTVGLNAPHMADVHLDTGRIQFQPLLALYAPAQAQDVNGQTELHLSIRGPLAEEKRLEAHLEIPLLNAQYKQLQLGAIKPIRLDYQNGTAVLQPTTIRGTDTDINLQASVPVTTPKAASFLVQGTVDLQIAQLLKPDLQSTGQLKFDIDSRRYAAASNLNGEIRIVNANLHTASAPIGLDNANGVVTVTSSRLEITSFQGTVGGGTITARGGMAYRPKPQFDLALAGTNVRLRYPEGLRSEMGMNLALTGNMQASTLNGQVKIERIAFTPDFDLTSFVGQFGAGGSAPAPSNGFMQNLKLNVAVQSTSQMSLVSNQVSIHGTANVRVAGTAADPVILGRATLTGGDLFFGGNRYVVQQGTIDFLNPVRTEPVVNLQVQTTIDQYKIAMNIEGPVERLHTTYTSDPALPPVDIINLIAFGKTTENPSTTQPGQLGAQSLLAQGVSSAVSSRVQKFAGLSHFAIDPQLGATNNQNPGARVAIQQRVTSNLYVTFATDVTSTQRQAIQLEYQLNPRWSLTGVRDQNGGFGADVRYKKSF